MKVTVRLFASFREAAGMAEAGLSVEPGTTVSQLWDSLVVAHPRLEPLSRSAGMALNGRYTSGDARLNDGDVAAFLPPVSGG
ncbi:MAG TPA: MoaD/ThiS family protein [Chloroflexia bacterium]|nr:MoaD/ThiS family protein [Chloroflexia bacterium]